jgi:ATP-dependent helicase/nuclease subunit A
LGEELRLLYVALTRARDTLILTAAVSETKWETLWAGPAAITAQSIVAARSYADWLGLWFGQNAGGAKPAASEGSLPLLRWRRADEAELADDPAEKPPEKELPPLDGKTLRKLRETLAWEYPFVAATERAAKSSVTALRRQAADEPDDEAEQIFPAPNPGPATRRKPHAKLSAADTGRAHHKFLQFVALEKTGELRAIESESKRLEQENVLSADERAALNLADIAAFWESATGQKIRAQAANVRRELAFTARFSPAELEAMTGVKSAAGLEGEFVVVQGVADLVVLLPKEIWLVDFKTDDIRRDGLPDKIRAYAPQLKLYAQALEKIYSRPVTARWLHFLAAKRTEEI